MTREEAIKVIEVVFKSKEAYKHNDSVTHQALNMAIESLQTDIVRCKDCKYFKLDHFDMIDGVPIIIAHEICTKWSGGSKTNKDGFCFMGERREP